MDDKKAAPQTVEEYLAQCPDNARKALEQLREAVRRAAPGAEERLSYGMPAFFLRGPLVYFGAFKSHIGFFPTGEGKEAFAEELKGYKGGKGTVQFPLKDPMPLELVERIVRHRLEANAKSE